MATPTETLLIYDLPLLAAANEQRGSAWIKAQAGVDIASGVLSRDELVSLKNFEQAHREQLNAIWRERDQQALLDLSARLKSTGAFAPAPPPEPALRTSTGSLALTIALLVLALLAAATLLQFAANSEFSFHRQAGFIYASAIVLSLLGWRFRRHLWRLLGRDSSELERRSGR